MLLNLSLIRVEEDISLRLTCVDPVYQNISTRIVETNVIIVMIGLTLHVQCSDRTPGIQRDRSVIRIDIGQRNRVMLIEIDIPLGS